MRLMKQPHGQDSRPKKFVAAKAIITSHTGNVLVVKPTYKDGWQLPGGLVEPHEDPQTALIRELAEELQLHVKPEEVKLVGTMFRKDVDVLTLVYEYVPRVSDTIRLALPPKELEQYAFVVPSRVGQRLNAYWLEFWEAYTK